MAGHAVVTGGAGYIGSHVCVALAVAGWRVTVLDDLSNGSAVAVERAAELAGRDLPLHVGDVTDPEVVAGVLEGAAVDAVVHLAGLKAVGESVAQPLRYYRDNIDGLLTLLEAMQARGVRRMVLSSSATVYGISDLDPLPEEAPLGATNPYGRTKQIQEMILDDLATSDRSWHIALLRYFNPVGAHPSGRLGEDPSGVPNNLMPFVMQVAAGRRDRLVLHGDDYPTPDGTCIRDYLHVMDLAEGHVAALEALDRRQGCRAWNLGTGRGSSVKEVVAAAEAAIGSPLPLQVGPRRAGDAVRLVAAVDRARAELGWEARRDLAEMCADHWNWQRSNPDGYVASPGTPVTATA